MRTFCCFITCAVLLLLTFPAAAQESQCLEIWFVWSDDTRHEVNLDTGSVVSSPAPEPTFREPGPNISFDGHYTAVVERNESTRETRLLLTDNRVGVTVVLAEHASRAHWSPNNSWLAYIQEQPEGTDISLHLFDVESGETVSLLLLEEGWNDFATILWSPDGSNLAVAILSVIAPEAWDIHLYSTPNLTLLNIIETPLISPALRWSPSGQSLFASGQNPAAFLIDTQTAQAYEIPVDGYGIYQLYWSPNETYLIISHVSNDWLDIFDVVNMQGEFLIEDVIVSTNYDGSRSDVDWINDHQILGSAWTEIGLYDLTLFDVPTGRRQILQENLYDYELSHNRHYAAVVAQETTKLIEFYDLTLETPTIISTLGFMTPPDNFMWRSDRLELLVLMEDRALRGYDFETETWREIATIPGDEVMMREVECCPP